MNDLSKPAVHLPPDQQAIRARCFHPSGAFTEFRKQELEQSIPDRFEEIVLKYPDLIAVKTRNQEVTYDALNRAANRLAQAILARRGEGQEPVALFFERGISLIVANMAVLKAGKISLHADPSAPQMRITHILEDSQASLILTDLTSDALARPWANDSRYLLNIDELHSNFRDDNLHLFIPPDAYADIAYTSGSTGQAKGAVNTHRQRLYTTMNFTNSCHICADDRLAVFGPSAIGKHLFDSLLNGATQYPLELQAEGLLHLRDLLIQEEITILVSLPTAFRHLVSTLRGGGSFPRLRLIRLAGEPLIKGDVESYKKHFASTCLLVNLYASKEGGTVCLYFIDKNTIIRSGRVPVGYPAADMEVSVIDEIGNQAGYDQPGEIVVKSRFLSSGYWQRNDLTREKFRATPAGEEGQVYFTGDLGRLSTDGCLEHLGRKDAMVKIRGFRADLGEVEATLSDHPGVKAAAVIAKQDRSGDTRLSAYVVPNSHTTVTITSLRNFLQQTLPDYMIPSAFITLDEMPLTATGKVDRLGLPDPDRSRPELDTSYTAPKTPIEKELAQIWAEVLALNRIGIHDNFFELGGHSLAATRVVSQVIKKYQLEIPLPALFQSPTVAQMAAVITENQANTLDEQEMDRILTELESLSDEQAEQCLVRTK
jgi:amino acid adenylation domain-containing protein